MVAPPATWLLLRQLFLVQAPQQAKHLHGENGLTASTVRRPRNREVTSRYKASSTTISPVPVANRRFATPNPERPRIVLGAPPPAPPIPNRRFPTPNVDRSANLNEVQSPKRAVSVERRRPSPSRTGENTGSKRPTERAPAITRRAGIRTELLWPTTCNLNMSMQFEPRSRPEGRQANAQLESRKNDANVSADHTLKPSANAAPPWVGAPRKPTPERKPTPVRSQKTDQVENSWPSENMQKPDWHSRSGISKVAQYSRPVSSSNAKVSGAAMNRSVDFSVDMGRPISNAASILVRGRPSHGACSGSHSVNISRAQSQSINEVSTSPRAMQKTSKGLNTDPPPITNSLLHCAGHACQAVDFAHSDLLPDNASDTDSVSSGGTTATTSSSGRGTPGSVSVTKAVRGTTVPARIWQDAASRSRRPSENRLRSSITESELSAASTGRRYGIRTKTMESPQGSHMLANGGAPSTPWSMPQNRLVSQPPSPSKGSPFRNASSPLRSRVGPPLGSGQRSSSAAVMLNFGGDIKKLRKGLSPVEEIHVLRMLHNRLLQWRFMNAGIEGAVNEQALLAEKSLYNVCMRIVDLRSSVLKKKVRLQEVRQTQNISALLRMQSPRLEEWLVLKLEHSMALKGAVQALEAAVLRVPVMGCVKADTFAVQEAISSTSEALNAIENSAAYLLPKADKTNSLVSELGHIVSQEKALLEECASLLATATALEIEERSIRTHLVQVEHERARVLGHLVDASTAAPADTVLV